MMTHSITTDCPDATKLLIRSALDSTTPIWELRYPNGDLYLRRTVLAGLDCLENHDETCKYHVFLHEINAPDGDREPHNHPWGWSCSLILSGGYEEMRSPVSRNISDSGFAVGREIRCVRGTGDYSFFGRFDYHRIVSVEPGTKTLFIAGAEEPRGWGFLVNGEHIDHKDYFQSGQNKMQTVRVR